MVMVLQLGGQEPPRVWGPPRVAGVWMEGPLAPQPKKGAHVAPGFWGRGKRQPRQQQPQQRRKTRLPGRNQWATGSSG